MDIFWNHTIEPMTFLTLYRKSIFCFTLCHAKTQMTRSQIAGQIYTGKNNDNQHQTLTRSLRSSQPSPPAPITKILAVSSMNSRTYL